MLCEQLCQGGKLYTVYAVRTFPDGWTPSPHPQPLPLARWHVGNRGALACQHAGLSLIGHVARKALFEGLPDKSETCCLDSVVVGGFLQGRVAAVAQLRTIDSRCVFCKRTELQRPNSREIVAPERYVPGGCEQLPGWVVSCSCTALKSGSKATFVQHTHI